MAKKIKVCIDKQVPAALQTEASRAAIRENPANAGMFSFSPGMGVGPLPAPFLALLTGKRWKNGRTLRVRFLDGVPAVQAKVEQYAQAWAPHANIKLVFGSDPDAEIRISFLQEGSWSYIGTDTLTIPKDEPTMNFGWLDEQSTDEEFSRVVTHEFGHALGCIHEHQNPAAAIPWNKDAVYAYYMGEPNNWSKEEVDFNLFERYAADITNFSAFDPKSIMLYPIPKQFTIGGFEVGWNTVLSDTDKVFMASIYPHEDRGIVTLTVGGTAAQASIGKHGEEDLYCFDLTAAGRYVIETHGRTDVVMGLFGPDGEINLVAHDDDSGRGLNARISAELQPGKYYVRVRHYRSKGMGKYRIGVKQATA